MFSPLPYLQRWATSDEYDTPRYALDMLLPYLPKGKRIWECAWGRGVLAQHMKDAGLRVVGGPDINFFQAVRFRYDLIVTNPPFSLTDAFIRHAYNIGKPFAFLMPIERLGGRTRLPMYRKHGLELLVPSKRMDFTGEGGKHYAITAWFCWRILPRPLMFVEAGW